MHPAPPTCYRQAQGQAHLCERFLPHDAYDQARTQGFDLATYQSFQTWCPA